MYSAFQLGLKYIKYYFTASNGKGHGIHSPFVYDLVAKVLNDKTIYPDFEKIEQLRKNLLNDLRVLDVRDFGAGSSVVKTNQRKVNEIANSSLKPKKYAQLLFRLVKYFNPSTAVELGTSLGITTSYLASAIPGAKIISCEGDESIAAIAEDNFKKLGLKNIEVVLGNFDLTIGELLEKESRLDLIYVDGNHRKVPTVHYFNTFRKEGSIGQIMIFDDIHWSKEMDEAWEIIKADDRVTLTVDLFFIGLVFFRKDFKAKQHFVVRF